MFAVGSRYAALVPYTVLDRRGRTVVVVPAAPPPVQSELGVHRLIQGERLDHLAHRYLNDASAFWRIAEENNAMLAESLSEVPALRIPRR